MGSSGGGAVLATGYFLPALKAESRGGLSSHCPIRVTAKDPCAIRPVDGLKKAVFSNVAWHLLDLKSRARARARARARTRQQPAWQARNEERVPSTCHSDSTFRS